MIKIIVSRINQRLDVFPSRYPISATINIPKATGKAVMRKTALRGSSKKKTLPIITTSMSKPFS
jgi:hypothetical protein